MHCLIALYNFEKYQIIIDTLRASRKMCCCMLTGRNVKKNVLLCAFCCDVQDGTICVKYSSTVFLFATEVC